MGRRPFSGTSFSPALRQGNRCTPATTGGEHLVSSPWRVCIVRLISSERVCGLKVLLERDRILLYDSKMMIMIMKTSGLRLTPQSQKETERKEEEER